MLAAAAQILTGCTVETDESLTDDVAAVEQAVLAPMVVTITSRHSGKCVDVNAGGFYDGANIQQWTCNGSPAQRFIMQSLGDNRFQFMNLGSGKCIDVSRSSIYDGANIQQWTCNGTLAQTFMVDPVGGGYASIINARSLKSLDVANWGTYDGANIQQWTYFRGANQQWAIRKAY